MEYNFDKVQDAEFPAVFIVLSTTYFSTFFTLNSYKDASVAIVAESYLIEDLFKLLYKVQFGDGRRIST